MFIFSQGSFVQHGGKPKLHVYKKIQEPFCFFSPRYLIYHLIQAFSDFASSMEVSQSSIEISLLSLLSQRAKLGK